MWERFVSMLNFRFNSFIFAKSQPSPAWYRPSPMSTHSPLFPFLFFRHQTPVCVLRSWPCPSSKLELLACTSNSCMTHLRLFPHLPVFPGFNLVAISSYNHFCFSLYIHSLAFPCINSSSLLSKVCGVISYIIVVAAMSKSFVIQGHQRRARARAGSILGL